MTRATSLNRRAVLAAATTTVAGLAAPWVIGSARAAGIGKHAFLNDLGTESSRRAA